MESDDDYNGMDPPKKGADKKDKRMSVERIYQKKTQLEHILLRPDTCALVGLRAACEPFA